MNLHVRTALYWLAIEGPWLVNGFKVLIQTQPPLFASKSLDEIKQAAKESIFCQKNWGELWYDVRSAARFCHMVTIF